MFNPLISSLLRSPLHRLLSKQIMLITYKGRKSGKEYTIPVNYVRDGNTLWTTSYTQRTWWRNLRGSASVTIQLRGKKVEAIAEVIEDEQAKIEGFMLFLHKAPGFAQYFKVEIESNGKPNREDVVKASKGRVLVRSQLVK